MSLTHCAATMPGLRRAIKMVAMLLLPGVAGQTGSQGGAARGRPGRNLLWSTHLSHRQVQWTARRVADVLQPSDLTLFKKTVAA